jgi:hypothetical protein
MSSRTDKEDNPQLSAFLMLPRRGRLEKSFQALVWFMSLSIC